MGYFSADGTFLSKVHDISCLSYILFIPLVISRVTSGRDRKSDVKKLRVICLRYRLTEYGRIFLVHKTPSRENTANDLYLVSASRSLSRCSDLHSLCMKRCKTLSRRNNIAHRCVARTSSSFLGERIFLQVWVRFERAWNLDGAFFDELNNKAYKTIYSYNRFFEE